MNDGGHDGKKVKGWGYEGAGSPRWDGCMRYTIGDMWVIVGDGDVDGSERESGRAMWTRSEESAGRRR